jgi:hypothetical protein
VIGLRLVTVLAALALSAPAAPAVARIHPWPAVGIGDQQPDMFISQRWKQLGVHDARYIAPWDVVYDRTQSFLLDGWLRAAGAAHVRAVIGFEHSLRSARLARRLPTWRQFQRAFLRLRRRYPFLHDFIAWNEANHPKSLTGGRPHRAAQYFDVIARHCRHCNIVAADLLDTRHMLRWLAKFRRDVHAKPRIWGLHNYTGANHYRTRGTLQLLAATRGQIWFTETGGVVVRRVYHGTRVAHTYRYGIRHAAHSVRFALQLSCLSRRIARIYLYEWQPPLHPTTWDSGLLTPRGKPRPSFYTLRRWRRVTLHEKRSRARRTLCRGAP